MRNITRQELLEAMERGAEIVEIRSGQPVKYQPRSEKDRRPWLVSEASLRQDFYLADDEVSVVTDQSMAPTGLTPVSALDDAIEKACATARAVLSLVSETLHHQFPTGAYLILTRPTGDYDEDTLAMDSVRDAQGETVRQFNPVWLTSDRLPDVPEDLAALWGDADPRKPGAVLGLLQRIDELSRYTFFDVLPEDLWKVAEVTAEADGGRAPLGLALVEPKHCAVCMTPVDEHTGRICTRP